MYHGQSIMLILFFAETMALIVQHRVPQAIHMCAAAAKPASAMRVKELKEELDLLGVEWRGVIFDKETLEQALDKARQLPPPQPPPPPPPPPPAETTVAATSNASPETKSEDEAYAVAYEKAFAEAMQLKVNEIRAELAARQTSWGGLFEKKELAARLAGLKARAASFSRSGALVPGEATIVIGRDLRTEMADARTPLLIDVFATWCGPCKMITPMLSKLAATLGERVRVVKLDSDKEGELSSELRAPARGRAQWAGRARSSCPAAPRRPDLRERSRDRASLVLTRRGTSDIPAGPWRIKISWCASE
jgi:hypothetical protein